MAEFSVLEYEELGDAFLAHDEALARMLYHQADERREIALLVKQGRIR